MDTALLKELAENFEANRTTVGKAVRELRDRDLKGFLVAAATAVSETPEGAGARFLLTNIITQPEGLELLCSPAVLTSQQSLVLVQQARQLDSQVHVKLARMLSALSVESDEHADVATRVLEVLEKCSEPATVMPALRDLLRCKNGRVRSKAALLIGRISRNPQWAKLHDPAHDQRVVANAIESLWGMDTAAAKSAFREAGQDPRNRVIGNAALGLYLAGEIEGAVILFRMSRHHRAVFRATAAWAMGHTRDPRFQVALARLREDEDAHVRSVAKHAGERVREHVTSLEAVGTIAVQVRTAKWHDGNHELHILVDQGGPRAELLRTCQVVVWDGAQIVEDFRLEALREPLPMHHRILFWAPIGGPQNVKVEIFSENGVGRDEAQELVY